MQSFIHSQLWGYILCRAIILVTLKHGSQMVTKQQLLYAAGVTHVEARAWQSIGSGS